jgi:hypothetical protein
MVKRSRTEDIGEAMRAPAGSKLFHAEFHSADASNPGNEAGARFTLYLIDAQETVYTLKAGDRLVIMSGYILIGGSALQVAMFDGSTLPSLGSLVGGTSIIQGTFSANAGIQQFHDLDRMLQVGTYPHLLTNGSGQIDSDFEGYIIQN